MLLQCSLRYCVNGIFRAKILSKNSHDLLKHFIRNHFTSEAEGRRLKAKGLLYATYLSGAIGITLISGIVYKYYGRMRKRAIGVEELEVPHYKRRSKTFCRYRGYVLPTSLIMTITSDVPWFDVRPDDVWVVSYPKAGMEITI